MLNVCPMLVSAWQKSRHLVTRAGSSPLTAADIMFTGQGHIGEVLGAVKITERLPVILSELIGHPTPSDLLACNTSIGYTATLVALHFTPVRRSVLVSD